MCKELNQHWTWFQDCNDDEEEVVTNAIIGYHLPEYDEDTGLELYYDEEAGKWKSR